MENRGVGVRKGRWTQEEDILLRNCIKSYGEGKWHLVPRRAGLNRCRKSCRLRWLNYLKPDIKRGQFTVDEVDLIIRLHKLLGNRWCLIAGRLPGRTANDVKNFWTSHVHNKLSAAMGNIKTAKIVQAENITQSNVVRPQPYHPRETREISRLTTWKSEYESPKEKNRHPSSAPSTSDEADECIRWWSQLLEKATDNNWLAVTDEEGQTEMPVGLHDVDQMAALQGDVDGYSDFCTYRDVL